MVLHVSKIIIPNQPPINRARYRAVSMLLPSYAAKTGPCASVVRARRWGQRRFEGDELMSTVELNTGIGRRAVSRLRDYTAGKNEKESLKD